MSKSRITVQEQSGNKTVVIVPNSLDEILDLLSNEPADNELATVLNFLDKTGTKLSFETPDSSWVERIEFNAGTSEINFVAADGAVIPHSTTLEKFVEDLKADSFGKLQWSYRRGLR